MRFSLHFLTTLASLLATATAFSQQSRREWLSTSIAAPIATVAVPLIANADDASLETFSDTLHGFSLKIPSAWSKSEQELMDRRKIVVWADPADPKTALFIAYTPIRDDFTSLSSFGAVDQVAAQTILPKSELAGQDNVYAEMLSSDSKLQAYFFDYKQEIAKLQPMTHFRTIFTLAQGATGGAGAVLVTITLQTSEERYAANMKPLFDTIIDSYGKVK